MSVYSMYDYMFNKRIKWIRFDRIDIGIGMNVFDDWDCDRDVIG